MAVPGNAQSNTSSTQRVKVYCCDGDGKWDDRGTGFISLDYVERSEELGLYVIDEDDHETLLVHRISTDDIYKKQEDSIISWREPEGSTELALSFQETAGCSHVWNHIYTMQRNLHFSSLDMNDELRELPDVDIANLPKILEIVTDADIEDEMLSDLMLKDVNFFDNLMNVFEMCEDLEKLDSLHMLFNIVKEIISLNSHEILVKILGDNLILKIIGCLEYNPDVPQPLRYRSDLRDHVVFKEAIPIKNPMVLSKIHQTYRIGYLKDVILTRVVDDDDITASLDSIIKANKATIVTLLKDDGTFFQELFAKLRSPSTSVESKIDLVHFLHEFCSLSKSLENHQKLRLFKELINEGIFDTIAEVLQIPEKQLILTGVDILLLTPDLDLLRSYLVKPDTPLLGLLVKGLMEDFGNTMLEFFRTLLDSNALSGGAQGMKIMDIFCEKHVPELVDFITASCSERPGDTSESTSRRVGSHSGETTKVLLNICELLCFCVQQYPSRKTFLLQNVTEKVLFLTRRKEKPIVAAAVRFFRTLLSVLDDNVQSYVVKNNLLKPIIDVFVAGGNHDDLLISSILALIEHIREAKATVLLKYVVDTFWDQLAPFKHRASIQALKYEPCIESWGPKSNTDPVDLRGNSDGEKSASASNTHKEEANPHNSNGEAASSAPLRSGRLVEYENDEDGNEDNTTPQQKQTEDLVKEREKRCRCREDEQEQCKKKQKLCSTVEGNKNSPEQGGGKAKERENS